MDPMQEKLQEYAKLLVQVGLHVEKGQLLRQRWDVPSTKTAQR